MTTGGCLQKVAASGALRMPGEVKSRNVDGTTFVLKHFRHISRRFTPVTLLYCFLRVLSHLSVDLMQVSTVGGFFCAFGGVAGKGAGILGIAEGTSASAAGGACRC